MKTQLTIVPLVFLLAQCSSTAPSVPQNRPADYTLQSKVSSTSMPQIINVSSYDPKERQRSGNGFNENNVSSLRSNGASGLIARAGKGGTLDTKCVAFLNSADRAGMMPGVYYRVQSHVDPVRQADQMVDRALSLARSRNWRASHLLLCGDYDSDLSTSAILRFMDRVESLTGVVPVAYLENSASLKLALRAADANTRKRLQRAPYWVALYSHTSGSGSTFSAPGNPKALVDQYSVWSNWTMWQYGGVTWENGRSRPKVYNNGPYRFSPYFGNLDRPAERNVFNGTHADLAKFWQRHGLPLR